MVQTDRRKHASNQPSFDVEQSSTLIGQILPWALYCSDFLVPHSALALLLSFKPRRRRRDLPPRSGGAVKFLCVRATEGGLLQRPGDEAIGRAIRRSMHELVTASIEMAGDCAFGGLPAVFFIE